jgi:hypothetical protein
MSAYGPYLRDQVEYELLGANFNRSNKIYLVYYGGSSTYACGGAPMPPQLMGNFVVLYLNGAVAGYPACNTNLFSTDGKTVGYWEAAALHDLVHALGFVPSCSPHYIPGNHVYDYPKDLMYAGSEPWDIAHLTLDVGHDDYYKHSTGTCFDLSQSVYLMPRPTNAIQPPGQPYKNLAQSCSVWTTSAGGSEPSTSVEFVNGRNTAVWVWWYDYTNQWQSYGMIAPHEGRVQATYAGTFWVVADAATGACLGSYVLPASQSHAIVH